MLVQSQSGFPTQLLAATAEELASHGYVVVGVNHTYEPAVTVFADGWRTVHRLARPGYTMQVQGQLM